MFVLEQIRGNKRYSIALPAKTEKLARVQFALFDQDPEAFRAERRRPTKKQAPGESEHAEFEQYLRKRKLSEQYIRDTLHYLSQWEPLFKSKPVSRFTLVDLQDFLAPHAAARKLIVTLKSYTKYLRKRGLLKRAEDPTLDLAVPAAVPQKSVKQRAYAISHVEQLYRAVAPVRRGHRTLDAQTIRDVLLVLSLTGLHYSELRRLCDGADGGRVEPVEHEGIAAVVRVWHKNGRVHAQSVDARTLAALERIRSRGRAPSASYIGAALDRTADATRLSRIDLGSLRHSFATWAKQCGEVVRPASHGVSLELVAEVLGHDPKTNRDFYQNATPVLLRIPIRLEHPDDPSSAVLSQPASA